MKSFVALILCAFALPGASRAADINIAAVTCAKYQNELSAPSSGQSADPINTVMWLFGYAVAKSGEKVMYGDALAGFGFALDAQCKNSPNQTLLDALAQVKPNPKNPMDLTTLECTTFANRHVELKKTDPESASTIMMWLFGFAVSKSGGHVFNADGLNAFETTLLANCAKSPTRSLYDSLVAMKL